MERAFLTGENCCLRPLTKTNLTKLSEWMNDDEVTRLLFTGSTPVTPNDLPWPLESDAVVLGIWSGFDFIGTTGLYSIHPIAHSAEFRILIGDKKYWGRGIGTECTKMIIDYGFDRLNLNMIWLGVNIENKAAIRVYEKVGFVHEGILRQVQYRNGRYYDVHRYSILREERCT